MDQNRMPLVEALQQFREEAPAYFRIPGHRFERGLDEALNRASLAAYDLSEAEGLDDLHHAEGVIAEAQRLAAETWKAKNVLLVNGTTCGNEAMVLSSVKEGEKIIVPRNVHNPGANGTDFMRSHTGLCDAGVQHKMADVGRRDAGNHRKSVCRNAGCESRAAGQPDVLRSLQ